MNAKNWIFTCTILVTLFTSGCIIDLDDDDFRPCERGRGPIVSQTINMPFFDGIDMQIPGNVYLRQGPQFEVVVEGYGNLIDRLETRVRNDIWEINLGRCSVFPDYLDIYITIPDIRFIKVSSSAKVVSENVLITNDIDLVIDGSGDIDLALDVDDVFASMNGSGDIYLEGRGDELFYEIRGSGDLRSFNCAFNEGRVRIDGSGDAEVFISVFLDVVIRGSGDVFYRGNPNINGDIIGSGSIINAN